MKIQIFQIRVNDGRRGINQEAVHELADSISKVGLLNPITVDQDYKLIAGLHRLEAAKLLGWKEIECNVSSLEGLMAELAEIDENFVRKGLSDIERGDLLLRRKEIYEVLHPETKHGGDRKSDKIKIANWELLTKSATGALKCDIIRKKHGGSRGAVEVTHDNNRRFGARGSFSAKVRSNVGFIFRI